MIDCVFKAILGAEKHKKLLVHFLNAVLSPHGYSPIENVDIKNPYNEKEYTTDKLTIVDIKAQDTKKNYYQIEVHLSNEPELRKHMLFNWSDIYQNQLNEGDDFDTLRPVISIWLLRHTLFEKSEAYHHKFVAYDSKNKVTLCEDFNIHVLETVKWKKNEPITREEDRWLYFFKEGKNIDVDEPPSELLTSEMEEAMSVLREFSEKEKEYDLYRNRMRALSMLKSYEGKIEKVTKELEEERKENLILKKKMEELMRRLEEK